MNLKKNSEPNSLFTDFENKIKNKQIHLGIIGMGYVGLPLALAFVEAGFKVTGFDLNKERIALIRSGKSSLKSLPAERIQKALANHKFFVTDDFSYLNEIQAIDICVPTPLNKNREPDLSYVKASVQEIAKRLQPGQLIILTSTTYPGTTEELVQPMLEENGLKAGQDFFLAYSPEREDPGNKKYSTKNIPKVVGGVTENCTHLAAALISSVVEKVVIVSNARIAEMVKLLENIYRCVNIALVNELKMLTDRMGLDIWEIIQAASTKPFGFTPFYPGPGLGGHCIPIDPFYLTWKAREYGLRTRFIELAGEINTTVPDFVISKTMEALNQQHKSINGSKILILGVAYKPDIDDVRESPALRIIQILQKQGAEVHYNDPFVPQIRLSGIEQKILESDELTDSLLQESDCVIIVTNHSGYDIPNILKQASLVVDTRNATQNISSFSEKIIKA